MQAPMQDSDADSPQINASEEPQVPEPSQWSNKSVRIILIGLLTVVLAVAVAVVASRLIHFEHEDAFFLVTLFIAIGLILAKVLQKTTALEAGWPIMAVIALPAVLYLVFAGYVTGLKVPGGLEVELQAVLHAPPELVFTPADILLLQEPAVDASGNCITGNYNSVVVQQQSDIAQFDSLLPAHLNCNGKIHYVVFTDGMQQLVGMVSADLVKETFADRGATEDLKAALDQANAGLLLNRLNTLYGPSEVATQKRPDDASAAELLQFMTSENIDAIAVTDNDGDVSAIIERDILMSQVLMKLSGIDKTPLPEPTQTLVATVSPADVTATTSAVEATPAATLQIETDAATPGPLKR